MNLVTSAFGRLLFAALLVVVMLATAQAQDKKPNILLIVSDDTGWGDLGPYLGGEARGMPTPNFDRLARARVKA
jgi:hypothetical protein